MNAKYYELIKDRDLINAFIDKRKAEMKVAVLTHEMIIQIQNEFLKKCREEAASEDEQ